MLILNDAPLPTDWMQAWGTIGGAALTVIAVALTGALLIHEVRVARKSREMAEEEVRPYVIVDFDFKSILALLVIQNIGKSIAYDAEVKFDPPLSSTAFNFEEVEALKQPIAMMAPGRKIPFFFDDVTTRAKANAKDYPMTFRVSIRYRDSNGKWYDDPTYILDLQTFMGSAVKPRELVEHVKDISDEIKKWRSHVTPLYVRAIDHHADLKREIKAYRKRQAAAKAQEEAEAQQKSGQDQ